MACSHARISIVSTVLLAALPLMAQTGGSIRGVVRDSSNALVAGAAIKAVDVSTGRSRTAVSNANGEYELPALTPAHYRLTVDAHGFKQYLQPDVEVTIGHVAVIDADLQLGDLSQVVVASDVAPQVETTNTQLGAVIEQRSITELPLNVRDTYQLLLLQPGASQQQGSAEFYGSGGAGVVSVNGGRERSNNYMVNGGDGNDLFVNAPGVEPSPDTVQEFRVITNAFDAEYGRNSGSVVNVVTKSGTNAFHGDAYEFFRNDVLNARNFFEIDKSPYKQNQYGFTLGGPVRKDKTFFFTSYEARRIRQGIPSPVVTVPTAAERAGDFSASGTAPPFAGSLNSSTIANQMQSRPGCLTAMNPTGRQFLGSAASGNSVPWSSIFPGNQIPAQCFDPTAYDLLQQFVPLPNDGANAYQTSRTEGLSVDQFTERLSHAFNEKYRIDAYYYFNDSSETDPFGGLYGGVNLPGFPLQTKIRNQQADLNYTWTPNATVVNEARFVFYREGNLTNLHPTNTNLIQNSCKTVPASQCFSDPANPRLGITPLLPANDQGVPGVNVSGGFSYGINSGPTGEIPQFGNTYQWSDNISQIVGSHSLKFGVDFRHLQFDQLILYEADGSFSFGGLSPNSVGSQDFFSDYLLGIPDTYNQGGNTVPQNAWKYRGNALYLFGQDSWKLSPSLTLNYGLRWELNTPFGMLENLRNVFRPGQPSPVRCQLLPANPLVSQFGTANCNPGSPGDAVYPLGLDIAGEQGIPRGGTSTYWKSFAPRIGLAWSPNWKDGFLGLLTGGPGKSSIRMGWGLFYNPIEQLVLEQFVGDPLSATTILSLPTFNTPFLSQTGTVSPNPYGGGFIQPGQPVDLSLFRPYLLYGTVQPHLPSQYADQYNVTIQRQLTASIMFQVSYVGTQGHRLLGSYDLNPSNSQTCLDIIQILGPRACGPYQEDSQFIIPANSIPAGITLHLPYGSVPTVTGPNNPQIALVGLRKYSSPFCQPTTGLGCPPDGVPVYSSIFAQDTVAWSNYNALQLSIEKRFTKGLQFDVAYTHSKSFDNASSFEGELDPFNFRRSYSASTFNPYNRFVGSFDWELPVPKMHGVTGVVSNGWSISGILTLQSGLPMRILSASDQELLNSYDFEPAGEPDMTGPFTTQGAKIKGCSAGTGGNSGTPCSLVTNQFFNPNLFTNQALGSIGNSPRTLCCGPGIVNLDISFLKNTHLTERIQTQFRAEFFNAFNHAQFYNPDGNFSDGSNFGKITQARDPRLIQVALKLLF